MPNPEIIHLCSLLGIFFFLIASFKNKIYFASAYLFIMIAKPGIFYPVMAKIRFELIIAIIAVVLIVLQKDNLKMLSIHGSKIVNSMLFFLLVIFASMLQAYDVARAWDRIYVEILPDCILVLLLLVTCRNIKDIKKFLWSFGLITAWLGYEPIYNFINGITVDQLGGAEYAVSESGLASGHVSLANNLLQGMPVLWYLGISSQNKFEKLAGTGLFFFCFFGVVISGSRGGFVGLVVIGFLISYFSEKRILMMTLSFLVIIASLLLMGDRYVGHIDTILQGTGSGFSANSRIAGLLDGIEMMIKRPILGVGPGCYPVVRKAWFGWGLWSHNLYGRLAGELGIIGIITWVIFMRRYLTSCFEIKNSIKTDKWMKTIATAIIVTTGVRLVLGMFGHALYNYIWYMMAALVVCADYLCVKHDLDFKIQIDKKRPPQAIKNIEL